MGKSKKPGNRPRKKNYGGKPSLKATSQMVLDAEHGLTALLQPHVLASQIQRARDELRSLKIESRKRLRAQLEVSYDLATLIRESPDAWNDFCSLPEWRAYKKRPKPSDPSDPLGWVLRYMIGESKRSATQRVSKYRSALLNFFENRVPADQIAAKIKDGGGIEALARANAAARKNIAASISTDANIKRRQKTVTVELSGPYARSLLAFQGSRSFRMKVSISRIGEARKFKGVLISLKELKNMEENLP